MLGACTSQRVLMLPWLGGQGVLALLLACLALYYLVLYPDSNCWGSNAGGDCTLLLWHSVIMVLSLMLLLYYIYIVSDFVGQLKTRREKDKATLAQGSKSNRLMEKGIGRFLDVHLFWGVIFELGTPLKNQF